MIEDPRTLTSADWSNIHTWIQYLSLYGLVIVAFVVIMLIAHAFIPSLIYTGHLSPGAGRVRLPLTLLAFVLLAVAVFLMAMTVIATLPIGDVYGRWLI